MPHIGNVSMSVLGGFRERMSCVKTSFVSLIYGDPFRLNSTRDPATRNYTSQPTMRQLSGALFAACLVGVRAAVVYPPTLANCSIQQKVAALAPSHVGVVWIERDGETLEDIRADFAESEARRPRL